jgi:hypothetical protein
VIALDEIPAPRRGKMRQCHEKKASLLYAAVLGRSGTGAERMIIL